MRCGSSELIPRLISPTFDSCRYEKPNNKHHVPRRSEQNSVTATSGAWGIDVCQHVCHYTKCGERNCDYDVIYHALLTGSTAEASVSSVVSSFQKIGTMPSGFVVCESDCVAACANALRGPIALQSPHKLTRF